MSTVHLDWQPVILLKVVRVPFGGMGGLSLKRVYLALNNGQLLYADWTLEADERAEGLVCATGWAMASLPHVPFKLQGRGAKIIPSGTWVLPYTDNLFALYSRVNTTLTHLVKRIDSHPTEPRTLAVLANLNRLL